jgi:uncharacterized protein YbbK (DUF523 family)
MGGQSSGPVEVDPALRSLFDALHGWALTRAASEFPDSVLSQAAQLGRKRPCIAVSACLLGISCRYNGGHKYRPDVSALVRKANADVLPICPEVLALLAVPRPPMTLEGGDGADLNAGRADVTLENGESRADEVRAGARRAALLAGAAGCRIAVLKERSPSCAVRQVHTTAGLEAGTGAFTALLLENGVRCFSEEETEEAAAAVTSTTRSP